MDNLNEHPQIAELIETLDKNEMQEEKTKVQSLVDYIGDMEQTLTGMLSELQNMRQEINLIHNNSLRAKCQNILKKTDDKIRQGVDICKKMRDNLIRSAGDAMKAFREKGKDALAVSIKAMKIPEVFDKMAVIFHKLSRDLSKDSRWLEATQAELRSAKGHLKNAGRLLIGKALREVDYSNTDKGVFVKLSRIYAKIGNGFASLAQKAMDAANKLRVNRVKDSVKTEIQNLKSATNDKTIFEPSRNR